MANAGLTEDDFPQKEWLTRRLATSPMRPIRIHVEVGTLGDALISLIGARRRAP